MFPLFVTSVVDTGGKFAAGVANTLGKFATGGKFAAGVANTDGNFAAYVVDTCVAP